MSAEDFQLIDDSKIDDSIIKKDCIKAYHQHAAEVNVENQIFSFSFGELFNDIQMGDGYFKLDIEI